MKTVALTMSMNENDYYLRKRYIECLARYAPVAVPVILPPSFDISIVSEYAQRFDGFVFTGGDDVDPVLYGEEKEKACGTVHRLRDEFEITLVREAVKLDKPILGICRGIQIMNVAMGGTLWQDMATAVFCSHTAESTDGAPKHQIRLIGKLRDVLAAESIVTNSYHHQSVKRLGPMLEAVAWSADGLIEGIWHGSLRFFLGIQWHPEISPDKYSERLIQAFTAEL